MEGAKKIISGGGSSGSEHRYGAVKNTIGSRSTTTGGGTWAAVGVGEGQGGGEHSGRRENRGGSP